LKQYDLEPITLENIGQACDRELQLAQSWMEGELASEQSTNLDYYYGLPFGNEVDGFSRVVTRDVLETVEGIMPDLMKIFTSGDDVVEFDPMGPADEERVMIQGKYINHLFMNRFNGYRILYDWFKDALLMKNGYIKCGWEDREECQFKEYKDLSPEQFQMLKDGEDISEELLGTEYEIDDFEKYKDDDGNITYDVRVKIERQRGRPDIMVIPSEELKISERAKSIKDADFVAHVTTMKYGELRSMGYDPDDLELAMIDPNIDQTGGVRSARFQLPSESGIGSFSPFSAEDNEVLVADCWIKLYDPDDNEVKLFKVFMVGRKAMEYMEVDRCPIISLAPIMMPHKQTGVAVADLVRDIQEIRSTIFRQMLDNLALQNAGRYTAVEGQVNLQDLIDNKIGGIVRQKMPNAVGRLDTPDLSQFTIPAMEMLTIQQENRTGVSRMTHGLDESTLSSHQTAAAVNQVMSAAQAKIQLIARNFAETGVKELFLELYNLIREYQTKPDLVPIAGRYAVVNPPEWTDRHDVHVTVGIGNGNKDQQLFHLSQISQMLQQVGATPYGYLITAENVFNLASEFIKNSGYQNPVKFISNPQQVQPPEPQPDPQLIAAQAAMVTAESNKIYKGAQSQKLQKETELEPQKFDWQKKKDAAEVGLEATQERGVGIGNGK